MTALGNAEADLRTYLMEHPFVSNKTTSCTVVNGTIAVSTFKVDPWAFRRHTKAIRKHLGKTVEDARVAAKAATAAYNKAKRAAGTARSKASPVDEEDVETLGRLQVQSVAAATCFAEAAAAFAATKKASITDDDVYAADPVLHANLPRGCHEVTFADADGTEVVHIWVKGLRKFTGLLPTDEDDDSGQEEGAAPPPVTPARTTCLAGAERPRNANSGCQRRPRTFTRWTRRTARTASSSSSSCAASISCSLGARTLAMFCGWTRLPKR